MKKLLNYTAIIIIVFTTILSFSNGTTIIKGDDTNTSTESSNYLEKKPSVLAKTAILIDADSNTILYDKKSHKKMYPASITKIMTALLTIENCKLSEKVTFTDSAIGCLSYDDANIGCLVGEQMTVKDCLYTLMLSSANEVAAALGEHISGSTAKFCDMMNARAKEAGATGTHFANTNGLFDKNHYVTAYDMAKITQAALEYPLFKNVISSTVYTVPKNNKRKKTFASYQRHKMIWPTSEHYYAGAIGGKTGYTIESGNTLVTCAKKNGMTLICVILHSDTYHVYDDTKKILDYGFNNFKKLNISENETSFSDRNTNNLISPFSETNSNITLDKSSTVVVPKNVSFSQLKSSVKFSLKKDSFATITYKYNDQNVGSATLKYSSTTKTSEQKATEALNTTSASSETATGYNDTNTTKINTSTLNLLKWLIPIILVLIILIIIIITIIRHNRKIKRIREYKRIRNRDE